MRQRVAWGQSLVQPGAGRRPPVRFVHDSPSISPPYSAAWAHATLRSNPAPPPGRLAPVPGAVARLGSLAPQEHVVNAHSEACIFLRAAHGVPAHPDDESLDGGEERLLAGLGEDALAGIRDEASGDDVRIAGSNRGHEAARGSRVGGVWDCRRVVPKHWTRPVGKNIESGRERRDVREKGREQSKQNDQLLVCQTRTCTFVPPPNVDRDLSPLCREENSKRGECTDEKQAERYSKRNNETHTFFVLQS